VYVLYYAIVGAQRGPYRRAWVTVTTENDEGAQRALITKIW
jgi:hypothetical protein